MTTMISEPTHDLGPLQRSILDMYATAGPQGLTTAMVAHRLNDQMPRPTPRAIVEAMRALRDAGLIERFGQMGCDRITDAGATAVLSAPDSPLPLATPIPHPGPSVFDAATGRLVYGCDAAGQGAAWRLWDNTGSKNALVAGSIASGTTTVLLGALRALGESEHATTWVVDLGIEMHVDDAGYAERVASTADEAHRMLADVREIQQRRARRLYDQGRRNWAGPTGDMPLGVLIILGLHTLGGSLVSDLDVVVRQARKVGISVLAEAKGFLLSEVGSLQTRDSLIAGGNLLALRMHQQADSHQLVGMPRTDPIPPRFSDGSTTAGLGYDATGRLVRAFHVG